MLYIIYLLTNNVNKKVYVGVTSNYKKRMREHSYAKNGYLVSKAIKKYGWKNFTPTILMETEDKNFAYKEAESFFINQYESKNPEKGYNLTEGGEGTLGYNFSEKSKSIMRDKKQGKKLSEEHRKKISESNKGRIFTNETKQKISQALKGNKVWLGKKLTDEHKEKLSKIKAKNWEAISPNGDLVKITNMRKFCIDQSLHPSAMSRVLSGKQDQHKGWKKYHSTYSRDMASL